VHARRFERTPSRDAWALFLVEFPGGPAEVAAVEEMHAALRHAVARVAATGSPIRWCGGWFVPADERCLCVLEAADEDCVVLARDTAALTMARVHEIRSLDDRTGTPPSPRSRGRS
jgi:hypothetical protein